MAKDIVKFKAESSGFSIQVIPAGASDSRKLFFNGANKTKAYVFGTADKDFNVEVKGEYCQPFNTDSYDVYINDVDSTASGAAAICLSISTTVFNQVYLTP